MYAADRDRLLQPDVWPDSIRISDWFFVDKTSQQSNDTDRKRQRMERPSQLGVVASMQGSTDVGVNSSNVGSDEARDDTGTTGVVRETDTTAASTADVCTLEAMVTDAASGHDADEDDADRTTIYQHGVC